MTNDRVSSDWLQEAYLEAKLAGWVARTRPLSGPLSPRGPQPVPATLDRARAGLNGPTEPTSRYAGLGTSASQVLRVLRRNVL